VIHLLLILALQVAPAPAAPAQPPAQPAPAGQPAQAPDAGAAQFSTTVGLLLVAVKPDRVKDYEAAILALQDGFQKSSDPARREMAKGWHVFKATETDAKKNALYIHALLPAIKDADYRPSLLLDEFFEGLPPQLMARYRDSLAGPPSKLSLTELAHMGAAAPLIRR
jgi:hypothetical protein